MSDQVARAGGSAAGGSAAGGGSAGGGSGGKWTSSNTAAVGCMTFLRDLLFFGFIVKIDSSETFTTLYIIELTMSGWCSMVDSKMIESRTSKTKLRFEIDERVTDMFQHPTNPNWLIVVTFTSILIFEFDEGKNSLRKICELKASGFQYIRSAHMSQNGQTLVLWTYNQEKEHIERTSRYGDEVVQKGIKSHCVRFFTLSSTGAGCRFSPMSSYTHSTMVSVEDRFYTGPMPHTSISQDGRFLFVVFRSNIIVLDVNTRSEVCVIESDALEKLSCMTVVSQRNTYFLVLLSSEGIITVFKFPSDLAVLELKSRYEIPKNATSFSEDMSTYKCIVHSSHAPMQFFIGGSKSSRDNGFIHLYMLSSNGEIQFVSEETTSLAVYEITSNKCVTCALSRFLSDDHASLSRIHSRCAVHSCHMILDTSHAQPSLPQSTLNGSPIELPLSSSFALLPDGTIVSSNIKYGLTLSSPNGKVASTESRDAHNSQITSVFSLEVDGKTFLLSFSSSDGIIKIWLFQKRGETVRFQIVATVSTEDIVQKKGVKFLALNGQTLLIVTNQQEILHFHVEITGGIRVDICPIPGPVVQISSEQIVQGISAVSPTHALIHVATSTSGVRGCSLVIVSFAEGAAEVFKPIGIKETGKSPAALTLNGFTVSAVVPTTVCSTALAAGGESCSFTPKDIKDGKLCDATILAIVPCEGGFIVITVNGFLILFIYDAKNVPVYKKRIAVLECALTPKCRLQVSGNTVMVCQPRDDGSVDLRTFQF